jgi:hypothetical protein
MNRDITKRKWQRCALVAALSLGTAAAQGAITEGRTADGHRYVTGGIGTEEVDALRQQAPSFSLQLITAARTGAYLANTQVRILGQGNNVVLDTAIDAPWLLVDLPAGRYTVQATYDGKTIERRLSIGGGKPQQVVIHFDAPVDADPAASSRDATTGSQAPR